MTNSTQKTSNIVNVKSGAQSMFQSGPAEGISYSDYIPIIGGDARQLNVEYARITKGAGRVTIEEDRIEWDDTGAYDHLVTGETATIKIMFDIVDETGTRETREVELIAKGGPSGTTFTNTQSGEITLDGANFTAYTAKDMLQDAHDFGRVKVVDVDFDLQEVFDVDLEKSVDDLLDMGELGALGTTYLTKLGLAEGAELVAKTARDLQKEIDQLEIDEKAFELAEKKASDALDGAKDAVQFAEDALNWTAGAFKDAGEWLKGAGETLADAGTAFWDWATNKPTAAEELQSAKDYLSNLEFQLNFYEQTGADHMPNFLPKAILPSNISFAKDSVEKWKKIVAGEKLSQSDVDAAQAEYDREFFDFSNAQKKLDEAKADTKAAIQKTAKAVDEYLDEVGNFSVGYLEVLSRDADRNLQSAETNMMDALKELQSKGLFTDIGSGVADIAQTFVNIGLGVAKEIDEATFNVLDELEAFANLEIGVDAEAQAGLVVDFKLDGGSVTSDLDYELTSTATYDDVADTFTVTALAEDVTSGDAVAFETVSPNLEFFAGIAFNVEATFDYFVDILARTFDVTLADVYHEAKTTVQLDGIFGLIDFDSKEFDGFEVNAPGFLGDIVSADFNFPTLETEGKASEFSTDPYTDPTSLVDFDKIADMIMDLADMRLEFSPELKAQMIKNGDSTEIFSDNVGDALQGALKAIVQGLDGSTDTDGDGVVPVFQLQTGEKGADALIHFDTIKNDLSQINMENGGKFGFFTSAGASNNLFQVNVDVDQLIATAVNVALGNTPQSTINPLDLSLGLGDILETVAVKEETIEAVEEFLTLDFNLQIADLDVRAGANFSQEFALNVEDMDFTLTFEDGTERQVSASEGGQIVIDKASDLEDTDGDGEIDYTLSLSPDATLFNDTELGLNVGYTMDFIKAQLELAASLPLDQLFPGLGLEELTGFSQDFSFGPLLRLDGDLDVVSADVFESLFDFDAGTAGVEGAFKLAEETDTGFQADDRDITVSHVPEELPFFEPGPAPKLAALSSGNIKGTKDSDAIFADAEADVIKGRAGNDQIEAGAGNDKVFGGAGADQIKGEAGRDMLKGGAGKDDISGGKGADMIFGGKGDDRLSGDQGADTFVFAKGHGSDVVTDFELGIDMISFGRGASNERQLELTQDGADTLIAFRDVEIRLEDVAVKELEANDSFLF